MAGDDGFIEIVFTMEGQRDLVGKFAAWGAAVGDMTPAWEEVGNTLLNDFAMQFEVQGGWLGAQIGPRWAPLKPATLADRARKGFPPGPILWRTGSLIESVMTRGAPGNIFDASPDGVIVGTAHPIAPYHQYGTRKMPARKMVGLRWRTRSTILNILNTFVRQAAKAAGLNAMGGSTGGGGGGGGSTP